MIAYIRHIPPARAGGRLARVYREIRADVPRVPNLIQAFSLRPETMAGLYRTWLASMWNGSVPRQTKEALAVTVSKAVNCDYCVDAHMVFLQALGVDRTSANDIEQRLDQSEALSEPERVAVQLGLSLTTGSRSFDDSLGRAFTEAWPDEEHRTELIAVIAGLNAVARMCNSLGVSLEIPVTVRRFGAGRQGAISLLSRLASAGMDFSTKEVKVRTPEENRAASDRLFVSQLGFPQVPDGLSALEVCPEIFDVHLRLMEKAVAVVPRDRWMRTGLVVGRLTGCDYLVSNCGAWLRRRGEDPSRVIASSEGANTVLSDAEKFCLRFVRDLTLYSHTIDKTRIDELRMVGMSDGAILDLAFVGGVFNGVSCLITALGHRTASS
ncbi:MAG: carboxymuconolactone decarboxylase family protein [Deltaproteobacteria bacterium]